MRPSWASPPAHGRTLAMAGLVSLAWFGMFVHNVADLPDLTLASPENSFPGLVWIAVLVAWMASGGRDSFLWLLFGWGAINLAGAVISVLPVPLLPFRPEQSLRHYAFHLVYGASQIPLLAYVHTGIRTGPGIRTAAARGRSAEG